MKKKIYLDNAATTQIDERVILAMLPVFSEEYGNASSLHSYGTQAKDILDKSRSKLASFIGARPEEIVFTSGGTESNNLAIKGIAFADRSKGNHIIVSSIEHDCVLNCCRWLETQGFYVTYLPVDDKGVVNSEELKKLINKKTILVSVMHANNEIGTLEPIEEIGDICKEYSVPFHSDACQSFGKIPIDVNRSGLDLLTINSHKIYGPKGVGALYIRKGTNIIPLLHGGGQEAGMRSTTENLPGIVGFSNAAKLCSDGMENESKRLLRLKNSFIGFLFENFENAYINGDQENSLPGLVNFSFHGLEGETIRLLLLLDEKGIAVSAGSACSSNDKSHNASHVLQAIGLNQFEARGSIRVSFGRYSTDDDLERFKDALIESINSLTSIFSGSLRKNHQKE
ncbi:MAG TPA: cysteine desulfurase family protein [Bacteroidales bacterium]|nr:cysteine desulfurase family protein [Bacteroidales bacterium]